LFYLSVRYIFFPEQVSSDFGGLSLKLVPDAALSLFCCDFCGFFLPQPLAPERPFDSATPYNATSSSFSPRGSIYKDSFTFFPIREVFSNKTFETFSVFSYSSELNSRLFYPPPLFSTELQFPSVTFCSDVCLSYLFLDLYC